MNRSIDHIDNIVTENYHTNRTNYQQQSSLSPNILEDHYLRSENNDSNRDETRSPSPILTVRPQHLNLNTQYTNYNQIHSNTWNNQSTINEDYKDGNVYDNENLINQNIDFSSYDVNNNNNNYYGYDNPSDYNNSNGQYQNMGNYNYDNLNSDALVNQYQYQQTWDGMNFDNNGNNHVQRDTFVSYPNEQVNLLPQNNNNNNQRQDQYRNQNLYRRDSDDGDWL